MTQRCSLSLALSPAQSFQFNSQKTNKHTYSMAIPIGFVFFCWCCCLLNEFFHIAICDIQWENRVFFLSLTFSVSFLFVFVLLQSYRDMCDKQATCAMYKRILIHTENVHMHRSPFLQFVCFACICTHTHALMNARNLGGCVQIGFEIRFKWQRQKVAFTNHAHTWQFQDTDTLKRC